MQGSKIEESPFTTLFRRGRRRSEFEFSWVQEKKEESALREGQSKSTHYRGTGRGLNRGVGLGIGSVFQVPRKSFT